ncbi:MAG: anti-sigma factor antagonist [Crocinitomix sp.]|nr:anti-sigma factor antagonist [Crocinitomix sp.]
MNFEQETKENYTLVSAQVEKLDATNAPELKAIFLLLNKSSVNNIVLDLSKSKYCDSSGLSSILIGNRLCKDTGGTFVLSGLQANVQKLIQISQLHKVLNIVAIYDEADAIFGK